jgi:hypothetical protein
LLVCDLLKQFSAPANVHTSHDVGVSEEQGILGYADHNNMLFRAEFWCSDLRMRRQAVRISGGWVKAVTFSAPRYLSSMEKIIALAVITGTVVAIQLIREPKLSDAEKLKAEWRG